MIQPNSEAIKTIGYLSYSGWVCSSTQWIQQGMKLTFIAPDNRTKSVIFLRDTQKASWEEDKHEQP